MRHYYKHESYCAHPKDVWIDYSGLDVSKMEYWRLNLLIESVSEDIKKVEEKFKWYRNCYIPIDSVTIDVINNELKLLNDVKRKLIQKQFDGKELEEEQQEEQKQLKIKFKEVEEELKKCLPWKRNSLKAKLQELLAIWRTVKEKGMSNNVK